MMRADTFRAVAAAVVMIALFAAVLTAVNRRPTPPPPKVAVGLPLSERELSAELRRGDALSPQDGNDRTESAHCRAVWDENRRHFLGRPTQSPAPTAQSQPATDAEARP